MYKFPISYSFNDRLLVSGRSVSWSDGWSVGQSVCRKLYFQAPIGAVSTIMAWYRHLPRILSLCPNETHKYIA